MWHDDSGEFAITEIGDDVGVLCLPWTALTELHLFWHAAHAHHFSLRAPYHNYSGMQNAGLCYPRYPANPSIIPRRTNAAYSTENHC